MANYTEKIFTPGQIVLESVSLISNNGFVFDLRPVMTDLTLTESMADVFVSGALGITESLNLPRFGPIVGNEYVKVVYYTPSRQKVDYTFAVTRISKRVLDNKSLTYYLELSSIGRVLSNFKQISKSFSNMSYSEMALSIFNDVLKTDKNRLIYKDTQFKKKYVAPFMFPGDLLTELASRSIDPTNNANFIFYETLKNDYHFRPVFDDSKPVFEYANFMSGIAGVNTLLEYTRIRELEIFSTADVFKNMDAGVFGYKASEIDTTKKTITHSSATYHQLFNSSFHINEFPILPANQYIGNSSNKYEVYPKASFSQDNIANNENYKEVITTRQFQLASSDSFSIGINVYGDSDRHIGDKVRVLILAPQAADETTEKYDPYLSGNYTIARIKNIIQRNQYTTNLLLIKDSNWQAIKEIN